MTETEQSSYFQSTLAEFVAVRTYQAYSYELGRREFWPETVRRTSDYLAKVAGGRIPEQDLLDIHEGILHFKSMPSMRMLAMAGPAVDRCNVASFNCCYSPVDSVDSLSEILYVLMQGTGQGLSVERRYVEKLPTVKKQKKSNPVSYVIGDSTEGWADALKTGLIAWYAGYDVNFDYQLIRPAGTPLRTKHGRASGPGPLRDLLEFTRQTVLRAQGRKLTTLECLEICNFIATIVVVGGTRRSSELALSDLDDVSVRDAKKGAFWSEKPWLAMANISAAYDSKPTQAEFDEEWKALATSGTGERGFFVRENARRPDGTFIEDAGTNPSLAAGTLVGTRDGIFPIEVLEGKDFQVKSMDGKWASAHCFLSSSNAPLIEIDFGGQRVTRATPQHQWPVLTKLGIRKVYTSDLKKGDRIPLNLNKPLGVQGDPSLTENDGFLSGYMFGNGWISTRPSGKLVGGVSCGTAANPVAQKVLVAVNSAKSEPSNLITQSDGESVIQFTSQPFLTYLTDSLGLGKDKSDGLPSVVWTANDEFVAGFIDGLYSSDGCVGDGITETRLTLTTSRWKVAEDLAKLLSFYGIPANISGGKLNNAKVKFPNGKTYDREYMSYEVRISHSALPNFDRVFYISHPDKAQRLKELVDTAPGNICSEYIKVKSITYVDPEPVWDISVNHNQHVFPAQWCYTGNCGEILLKPREFCNLSSVVARVDDTRESLAEKVRLATIIGTLQSTLTNFRYLREDYARNCNEERLLGVSLSGHMDSPVVRQREVQEYLRDVAQETNKKYAKLLGVPKSAAITCVKPEGTASIVVDSSSGMHPRFGTHFIRRVRIASSDPLLKLIRAAGVPLNPENGMTKKDATVWVASFPCKSPDGAITRHDITAIEQLEYWAQVKTAWCDHNPSQTVYVDDQEWTEVGAWVFSHWDVVGGLSFLPKDNSIYEQMPYTDITAEEYDQLVSVFPKIDYKKLARYEKEDMTEGSMVYSCVGDKCDII